ncbi:MAG: PilW family protein [Steroidobacter sp.]
MRRAIHGMTLIELMVSMVLGLIIIGGATGVILANRQSYRTNEALSQVQEGARTAFELMARDVREAGIMGCDSRGRIANVLNLTAPGSSWWRTWVGIMGYEGTQATGAVTIGTGTAERVTATDSIMVQGIQGAGLAVENHDAANTLIRINSTTSGLIVNDVLVMCDFDHAAIFQVSNFNATTRLITHQTGVGTPSNCVRGLGYPVPAVTCGSAGLPYTFAPNAQLTRLAATTWYVGNNGRTAEGGRSLYRIRMGTGATLVTEEIVPGVNDLQLQYREQGRSDFRDANVVTSWANVNAVRVQLTMLSTDQRVTTDITVNAGRLRRDFTNIVALRNRVP